MSEQPNPEAFMRMALEEADRAAAHGDVPVGAVVVSANGNVLAREHNRREQLADPTAHAELLAIRAASRGLPGWRLEGATVYVRERRPTLYRVEWGSSEGWLTPGQVRILATR